MQWFCWGRTTLHEWCYPGIPSYLRGIKYPGIFRSYHPENTPHSSRILRQLVCTRGLHRHMYGFQWHFGVIFPSQDSVKTLLWSIILFTMYYFTAVNIFLSLHYTEILNSIIIPSIRYHTEHGSESFTESHPILRKDKFTTNINLWQFSVLNRSINSTLTRFIIKLAYNNYQFLSFILTLSSRRAYVRRHKKPSVLAWGVSATPWGNRPISQLQCVLPSIKLF